jgi:hypothetical protein
MDYGNLYMVFHNKVYDFDRKYLFVLDLCYAVQLLSSVR